MDASKFQTSLLFPIFITRVHIWIFKAKIAAAIHDVVRVRGLTQKQAAGLMEIDQPKVSKVIRGNLTEFSTEWLLSRLLHLGVDVDIVAHTKSEPQKREGSITFACV